MRPSTLESVQRKQLDRQDLIDGLREETLSENRSNPHHETWAG
jgi:hypothetical protein